MARGSKTTESQPKKKSDAAREGRVALKRRPARANPPQGGPGGAARARSRRAHFRRADQARYRRRRHRRARGGAFRDCGPASVGLHHVRFGPGAACGARPGRLRAAVCSCYRGRVLSGTQRVPLDSFALRMGVGLAMLFFAFETILSLFIPGADTDSGLLFAPGIARISRRLSRRGRFLGAARAARPSRRRHCHGGRRLRRRCCDRLFHIGGFAPRAREGLRYP